VDGQGDAIISACDNYNLIILNDGLLTFISSLGQASSTIDLSIATRSFGLLASVSTLQDLHGSDHFPVSISVANTSPSMYRFTNKPNLSDKQLVFLFSRLSVETPRFHSFISSSSILSNLLLIYEKFCSFLSDNISPFFPHGIFLPERNSYLLKNLPLLDGIPYVMRQLILVVSYFVYIKPARPSITGSPLSERTYCEGKFFVGRRERDGNFFAPLRLLLPPFGDLYGLIKINLFR